MLAISRSTLVRFIFPLGFGIECEGHVSTAYSMCF
jgi:hypothetical protein